MVDLWQKLEIAVKMRFDSIVKVTHFFYQALLLINLRRHFLERFEKREHF
jgi:hypothetical protein